MRGCLGFCLEHMLCPRAHIVRSHTRDTRSDAPPLPHPNTTYAREGGAIICAAASASSTSAGAEPCLMRQHIRLLIWNTRIPRGYRRTQAAASLWTSAGRRHCCAGTAHRTTPYSQCVPPCIAHFSSVSKKHAVSVAACAREHRWQASTRKSELQPEQNGPQAIIIRQLGSSTCAHIHAIPRVRLAG